MTDTPEYRLERVRHVVSQMRQASGSQRAVMDIWIQRLTDILEDDERRTIGDDDAWGGPV